jgi:leucyl aminopeptidase (aminopeptidase T)
MQSSIRRHLLLPLLMAGPAVLWPTPARAQDAPTAEPRTSRSVGSPMAAAAQRLETMAPNLVESARIKPGQLVAIHGGPAMVSAMEAMAVAVQKQGGYPVLLLDSPKASHSYFADVPEQYLGHTPRAWQDFQASGVDVDFQLPVFENFLQTVSDVPAERQGKVAAAFTAGQSELTARQNRNHTRRLNIVSPPNASDAEQAHVDLPRYVRLYNEGLDADYRAIAEKGRRIQAALRGARRVRITSPEGTDLSFAVGNRPVVLDAGMSPPGTTGLLAERTAQLPGGAIRLAPVETSVTGTIHAPSDNCDHPVKDEVIDVRAGMPTSVRAKTDEACVKAAVQRAGRFGWVEIGLNPALQVKDPGANLVATLLDLGAGAVTVNFGTNQELGGANKTASGGWFIVLPGATIEADGKVVVRNGELAM